MSVGDATLLRAEDLTRRYDDRLALSIDVLEAHAGEVLALLGPNGAGKSTLFRLLLLLERADTGRIRFDGREVVAGDIAAMRRLAGVFQRPFFYAGTVAENVAFGLSARGIRGEARTQRVREALAWVHLDGLAGRDVHTLSGGEAQRVALARALVVRPELLLLDEPTANLDVTAQRGFRQDLSDAVREHARSAILITHDPGDAFELADRVAVIEAGRLVQTGIPAALHTDPATAFVAAVTGSELLPGTLEAVDGHCVAVRLDGDVRVLVPRAAANELDVGAAVRLAYRPERVALRRAHSLPEQEGDMRARVVSRAPAGGFVRVSLDGPPSLVALVPWQDVSCFEPGEEVVARLEPASLHIFQSEEPSQA